MAVAATAEVVCTLNVGESGRVLRCGQPNSVAADVDLVTRYLTMVTILCMQYTSISRKFPFGKFFSREWEKFLGPGKFGSH